MQGSSAVPRPALATLCQSRFWRDGWIYERSLGGQRCMAVRDADGTHLYSRNGREVTSSFPEVVDALEQQPSDWFVIDGEMVAFEDSHPSFERLRPRIQIEDEEQARRSGIPIWFYAFDVLEIHGEDLRGQPLLDRRRRLLTLLEWRDPLRLLPHRLGADEDWFADICRHGWEGVVAKRADGVYATGHNGHWLKFKCETPPRAEESHMPKGDKQPSVHESLRAVSGLSEDDVEQVWAGGTVVTVPAGWSMVHELEPPDTAYLILEGRVRISLRKETVAELGPGDFVGEIAPIAHRLRTATVTALEPLITLAFPTSAFARLRQEVPAFDEAVTAVAEARMEEIDGARL